MSLFSTEIPIKGDIDKYRFIAQASAWVKGMPTSTLFQSDSSIDQINDEARLTSLSGEVLTLKECELPDGFAIGARHEIPDNEGRVWRSEVILTTRNGVSALRSKTQCILVSERAKVQIPKKPFFIKMIIDDGWASSDGAFSITQAPHIILDSDLDRCANFMTGRCDSLLPIVYISRSRNGKLILTDRDLNNLAFKLGGIAHVAIEPSYDFSLKLKQKHKGKMFIMELFAFALVIMG